MGIWGGKDTNFGAMSWESTALAKHTKRPSESTIMWTLMSGHSPGPVFDNIFDIQENETYKCRISTAPLQLLKS